MSDTERVFTFEDLRMGPLCHLAKGTAANYKTVLNKINKEMGLEKDTVYVDKLLDDHLRVVEIIRSGYKLVDTSAFAGKVSKICCVISACGVEDDDNIFKTYVRNPGRYLSIEDTKDQKKVIDWPTLSDQLMEFGMDDDKRMNTIALIMSYGYTLRIGEILDTTTNGSGENNLDLDTGEWIIRRHKNSKCKGESSEPRVFTINEELKDILGSRDDGIWLVKNAPLAEGEKKHCRYLKWGFPNNWEIRTSRETWLNHNSGYSDEEIAKWAHILGHTKKNVKTYYDSTVKFPRKGDSEAKTEVLDDDLDECQTNGASPVEDSE